MNTATFTAGTPQDAWRRLHAMACQPYRAAGRFAYHFARGKLGRDPVFRGLLERGDLAGRARVLDIGCGSGLVASLLHHTRQLQREGNTPWAEVAATAYTGIELMAAEVERGRAALSGLALAPQFVCADMREAPFAACDLVVILDVLHYVPPADQQAVLQRVRAAVAPHGRLLLRVGDMADRRGYAFSEWTDRIILLARGHRSPRTWGRTVAEWTALLEGLGFTVRAERMSQGTPFANTLLVADLHGAAP